MKKVYLLIAESEPFFIKEKQKALRELKDWANAELYEVEVKTWKATTIAAMVDDGFESFQS